MAALTPEQLAALAQQFSGTNRLNEASYGGYQYIPQWQMQYSGQEALDPTIGGYRRYVPGTGDMAGKVDGLTYEDIDRSGNVTGTGTFSGIDGGSLWDYGPFLMLAAGMAPALMGAGAGAGAGATGAGEAMGASGAAMGDAGMMYAGQNAAAAGTLGGGYMGGAGGVGAAGVGGVAAGGAGAAAGGAGAAGAAGAGGLLSGAGGVLGPAATVIGALAGSQGTPGQTSERKMDPRLDQYVYGDLMPKVQGLLNSQMPLAQQAGQQMRQVGTGLLGAQIAPNGFNLFTKGRY